ncbi:acyl-CoA carboxylase epsilon subunit [Streptomyces sp. NPDC058807]|uniref:acyl-CoA carboxylase epsilon subunit n=1 Tax=unclassified Streptomyces TaxID=2593676 RepID=UPI0036CD0555
MENTEAVLRVERGRADEVELAAVAAVLLARARIGRMTAEAPAPAGLGWWRPVNSYTAPGSWR